MPQEKTLTNATDSWSDSAMIYAEACYSLGGQKDREAILALLAQRTVKGVISALKNNHEIVDPQLLLNEVPFKKIQQAPDAVFQGTAQILGVIALSIPSEYANVAAEFFMAHEALREPNVRVA
jgi:hypothetical protein